MSKWHPDTLLAKTVTHLTIKKTGLPVPVCFGWHILQFPGQRVRRVRETY